MKTIKINPINKNSIWGAIKPGTNELICEGMSPEEVIKKANKIEKKYIMMFLFPGNANYIYCNGILKEEVVFANQDDLDRIRIKAYSYLI